MINISRDIHSISDFKRKTPDFVKQLKKTGKPVVLTMNGRARVVIQDADSYQDLLDLIVRLKDIEAVGEGLADVASGDTLSIDEFDNGMKLSHPMLNRR
jgi:prevent-host-death family protein